MQDDRIEDLRKILENNNKPICISEIARQSKISRITAARYLDQMHMSGQTKLFEIGKAKKYLLVSERSTLNLCDLSTNFILILDHDLKIVYVNEAYLRFSHSSRNSVMGKRIESINLDIFASADVLLLLKKYRGEGLESHTIELQKNGTQVVYTITIAKVQFTSHIPAIAIIAQDITLKRRMETEGQFLASIVSSSEDAIIGVDLDTTIISWNNGAEQIFGYTPDDIIGKQISVLHTSGTHDLQSSLLDRVLCGEVINQYETQQQCKNGSVIDVSLTLSQILDPDKGVIGFSFIVRNITNRKSIENALKRSKEKINILSSITRHDVLNQLQALNAFCDLIRSKIQTDPQALEYLTYIGRCSDNISEHILFSRDYQELGDNVPVWQHIGTMARMAAVDYLPDFLTLTIHSGDYEIFADPMLMLVFYNLFENSKQHGKGVTTITISFLPDKGTGTLIYEDNGVGVPDLLKSEIFEKGVGNNSGLGLFLVREILSITGLTIQETGTEGQGARFEIAVPSAAWRKRGS